MSAGQLAFDFLAEQMPLCSGPDFKTLFVIVRSGPVGLSQSEIAKESGNSLATVKRGLRTFRERGAFTVIKGGPVAANIYHTAAESVQSEPTGWGQSEPRLTPEATADSDTRLNLTPPAATEKQHVSAATPAAPVDGLRQGVQQGEGIDSRASIDVVSSEVFDSLYRIGKADPNQNLPEKEKQNQNQPRVQAPEWVRGDKRRGKSFEQVQEVEQMLWEGFGKPYGWEPLGVGGDDAAGWLLDSRLTTHKIGSILRRVSKRLFDWNTGEPKYAMEKPWRVVVKIFNQIRCEDRIPVQRETRRAEPLKVAVGQQGEVADPQWSQDLVTDLAKGAGGGG